MVKLPTPTAAELDAAKAVLAVADTKAKRSRMACFTAWAKSNNCQEGLSARGPERQQWLLKYMAYQMQRKDSNPTTTSRDSNIDVIEDSTKVFWWSKHKMGLELGLHKAQSWIESGKLESRPDEALVSFFT